LAELRQRYAADNAVAVYTKATLNAAIQAIEDTFETTVRAAFSTAINTATAPTVLTNAQKKRLVALYLGQKMSREGV
jgi:hypothetical protein